MEADPEPDRRNDDSHAAVAMDESTTSRSGLDKQGQEHVGYLCKRLIDMGRVHYLTSMGYDARFIRYVDPSVSLENVALIATPPAKRYGVPSTL